jgi:hypothetical protein
MPPVRAAMSGMCAAKHAPERGLVGGRVERWSRRPSAHTSRGIVAGAWLDSPPRQWQNGVAMEF